MKFKWTGILLIAFITPVLILFMSIRTPVAEPEDKVSAQRENLDLQSPDPNAGLAVAAENEHLILYFDNKTGGIAVEDKASGQIFRSNPENALKDPKADDSVKQELMSQIELVYNVKGEEGDLQMNSYTHAMLLDQLRWVKTDNGLTVEMIIGRSEQKLLLPLQIRKSSFETNILDNLKVERSKKQMAAFYILYKHEDALNDEELLKKYPVLKNEDIYVFKTSATDRDKRILEGYVKEAGYTYEMLEAEYKAIGFGGDDTVFPSFKIYLDYVLHEDSLSVALNAGGIQYSEEEFNLESLSLLNYFGAGQTGEEGYIFLPDGSGTLINFNNDGSKKTLLTTGKLYGWDSALTLADRGSFKQEFRYPVFGIKRDKSALLAVIDDGDAVADINGMMGNINHSWNTAYASFTIKNKDRFIDEFAFEAMPWILYEKKPFKGNIKVRYYFLTGDNADYVGMAKTYQKHLVDTGVLKKLAPRKNIPFYMETMGSVDMIVRKLGIPMLNQVPITTFDQAADMMEQLSQKGVGNIKIRYKGWYNGGLYYTAPTKMKVERVLGGSKGLKKLSEAALKIEAEVYPDIDFMYVLSQRFLDGFAPRKDSIRTLFQKTGYFAQLNPAFLEYENKVWCINPTRIPTYYKRFIADYDKLNIKFVSLASMGKGLYSNFKKNNQVNRHETKDIVAGALEDVSRGYDSIISDYGNAYIFPYVNHVLNLPEEDSSFLISDNQVPFIQIVLHGYISYAGEPLNLANELAPAMLRAIEYGSGAYFVLNYGENSILKAADVNNQKNSMYYLEWDDEAAAAYARMNDALSDVQDQTIKDHKQLDEKVYMTTYENGKSIIVNYRNEKVNVEGTTVEPLNFAIID